jgi:hypothetical protein
VLLLLQEPPVVVWLSVIVSLTQTIGVPVIVPADGAVLTVTVAKALQPPLTSHVIIAVPAAIPFKTPVLLPMVATERLPLLQLPPLVAVANVTDVPLQSAKVPVIGSTGSAPKINFATNAS